MSESTIRSPFPGMDPFLEASWRDVHQAILTYARDHLQAQLPGDLRARLDERVFVDLPDGGSRSVYPDVKVVERRAARRAGPARGGAAVAEPLIVSLRDEPVSEGFIEILDIGSSRRVVTVIELLSPANKRPGDGQDLFLKKQAELRESRASAVEIDLLRAGQRVTMFPPERLPERARSTYQVCIRWGWRHWEVGVYSVRLREPLPVIRVPLRETDEDASLDLQAVLDRAYVNGGYDDTDYTLEPVPPLAPDDAAWADALLREKGFR